MVGSRSFYPGIVFVVLVALAAIQLSACADLGSSQQVSAASFESSGVSSPLLVVFPLASTDWGLRGGAIFGAVGPFLQTQKSQ